MRLAWLLNLDAELELGTPSYRAGLKAARHLAEHGRRISDLLGPDDILVPLRDDLAAAHDASQQAPATDPPVGVLGRAWCVTPGALARFRKLGITPEPHPPLDVIKRVNHRLFAHQVGGGLPGQVYVDSYDALHLALQEITAGGRRPGLISASPDFQSGGSPDRGGSQASSLSPRLSSRQPPMMLKRPFAVSGRGQLRLFPAQGDQPSLGAVGDAQGLDWMKTCPNGFRRLSRGVVSCSSLWSDRFGSSPCTGTCGQTGRFDWGGFVSKASRRVGFSKVSLCSAAALYHCRGSCRLNGQAGQLPRLSPKQGTSGLLASTGTATSPSTMMPKSARQRFVRLAK